LIDGQKKMILALISQLMRRCVCHCPRPYKSLFNPSHLTPCETRLRCRHAMNAAGAAAGRGGRDKLTDADFLKWANDSVSVAPAAPVSAMR
jgi:hypothetical protein